MTKKMNYWFVVVLVVLSTVAFAILLHHFLISGRIADLNDLLHHETFFVLTIGVIGGLIIAAIPLGMIKKR